MTKKITVPLLPLRGVVLFPSAVLNLDVGRDKSVQALEKAMLQEELILLVTQKESDVEQPNFSDLYSTGTLAQIKEFIKLPNGAFRVLVEGQTTAEITRQLDMSDYMMVEVEVKESAEYAGIDGEVARRTMLEYFGQYIKLSKKLTPDVYSAMVNVEDIEKMANMISHHLPLKVPEKQKILEMNDLKERVHYIISIINNEKEIIQLERKLHIQVRQAVERTQKEYYLREQMKAIQKELGDKDNKVTEVEELKVKIKEANMPEHMEKIALKELTRYERIPTSSPENTNIRTYLDWLINLPWSKKTEDHLDVNHAEKILNEDHHGLEKVKERVLEYLAVQQLTNSLRGPILCLVGPPGVGKTSLARSIARSLERKFVRVSLGGVRDESEIRGHRRTYIGAMPGRIIQGMKRAETINPVFLLDEIDKMSNDFRGDPSSAMLEVLDPEQNHSFSDHYIEEPYDLSNVMFIATANNLGAIPGPLRDRMEIISIAGYTELEKLHIAKDHLLPKQIQEHGLTKKMFQIRDEAIMSLIRYYTREAGVRSLERQLASLCRKAVRLIVGENRKKVVISEKKIEEYLGKKKFSFGKAELENQIGVATGLAYTTVGGDTLSIEVSLYPGKGRLVLTGKLGDVMKESAQAALSYIRSRAEQLKIDPEFYDKNDIHIHVPEGAVPKDGPSAGITMATALISAITNRPVHCNVGMTGEITLRGHVLPIGGLKEKSLSAHRAGLTKIIIPKENEKDLDDIPDVIKQDLTFVPVTHLDEVLKHALVGEKK